MNITNEQFVDALWKNAKESLGIKDKHEQLDDMQAACVAFALLIRDDLLGNPNQ